MRAELDPKTAAWIETLPLQVREVAIQYPPTCYRMLTGGVTVGHYLLMSYDEHPDGTVTMTIKHGADDYLAGVGVFGIKPESLWTCGCGQWREANEVERAESALVIDAAKAAWSGGVPS